MITLLDMAIESATGERQLSRKQVIRLLDHLYQLAAFIEKRYHDTIERSNDMDWENNADTIDEDF